MPDDVQSVFVRSVISRFLSFQRPSLDLSDSIKSLSAHVRAAMKQLTDSCWSLAVYRRLHLNRHFSADRYTVVVHRMSNGGARTSRISRPPQDADPQIEREAFTPKSHL